jgi:hypothetical protein
MTDVIFTSSRAFLIYSDALKKGEEERMNLELRNSGNE